MKSLYLRGGTQTVVVGECLDSAGFAGRNEARLIAEINTDNRHLLFRFWELGARTIAAAAAARYRGGTAGCYAFGSGGAWTAEVMFVGVRVFSHCGRFQHCTLGRREPRRANNKIETFSREWSGPVSGQRRRGAGRIARPERVGHSGGRLGATTGIGAFEFD